VAAAWDELWDRTFGWGCGLALAMKHARQPTPARTREKAECAIE
jgi:hypothetical protein